jgi:hypothetical protein
VLPLTAKQRKRWRQTRVTGHLRTKSEGLFPEFVKPKTSHTFLGVPSVTIAAAVAKDRVIMWHVLEKNWCGAVAADMYSGPLLRSLKRTWGEKRHYTIVEDGDLKGNQSGLGIKAKEAAHIRAMTLPPRTPSWMPLDFSIWAKIEAAMDKTAPEGTETKADFIARLARCARTLPRSVVREALGRMKGNIQGVIDARGYYAKND